MTPPSNGGWTIDTLKAHLLAIIEGNDERYSERYAERYESLKTHLLSLIDANDAKYSERFEAQRNATNAALEAARQAVQKAEVAAEKRFESVNEFRNTLGDQQRNLMPRAEVDVIVQGMKNELASLEKRVDTNQGQIATFQAERAGVKGGWAIAVGVVGFVLVIASLIALASRLGTP